MGERPILFVDVDGVLALWDAIVDVDRVYLVDDSGVPLLVPVGTQSRLDHLQHRFQMVWATSWAEDAPEFLAPILCVGADWPVLDFDLAKWQAICDYADGRPFAWVDDDARGEALDLRDHCPTMHLVVHADHRVGLDDDAVARLIVFADQLVALPSD